MHTLFITVLLIALVALISAAPPENLFNEQIKKDFLNQLNVYKCMHGQDPAQFYKWSTCVENFAQNWAQTQADDSQMKHSNESYNQKSCESAQGFGENVGAGYGSVASFIDALYAEVKCWDFATGTGKSGCGVTGHFTSMIWKDSDRTAIGVAVNSKGTPYYSMVNGSSNGVTSNMNMGTEAIKQVTPISRTKAECQTAIQSWAAGSAWELSADTSTYEDPEKSEYDGAHVVASTTLAILAFIATMFF